MFSKLGGLAFIEVYFFKGLQDHFIFSIYAGSLQSGFGKRTWKLLPFREWRLRPSPVCSSSSAKARAFLKLQLAEVRDLERQ
jgi:hypothetical protein